MTGNSYSYLIVVACPGCGERAQFVESFDSPVSLDIDIPPSAEFCPRCGLNVNESDGMWDLQEETAIQRREPFNSAGVS